MTKHPVRRRGRGARHGAVLVLISAAAMTIAACPPAASAAGSAPDALAPAATLAAAAANHGRYFGARVPGNRLATASFVDILHREFSSVTPEAELLWDATEPQRGAFNFAAAERVVAHAEEHGMLVRGHSLAWHSQQPGWANALDGPPLRAAMLHHVSAVAGHFAGRIHSWNVASEAFADNGARRASNLQRTGDDWIDAAFRAARDADPNARLCYDDYHIEGRNPKSDAVYAMVRDLRDRGVPIDCVGFQSHFNSVSPFPADLRANLERFAALGVEVQITELDAAGTGDQPEVYAETVRACLAVPRCTGITVSSIRDSDSWRAGDLPALFDRDGNPKPAYAATLAALNESPRTTP